MWLEGWFLYCLKSVWSPVANLLDGESSGYVSPRSLLICDLTFGEPDQRRDRLFDPEAFTTDCEVKTTNGKQLQVKVSVGRCTSYKDGRKTLSTPSTLRPDGYVFSYSFSELVNSFPRKNRGTQTLQSLTLKRYVTPRGKRNRRFCVSRFNIQVNFIDRDDQF